MHDNRRLIVLMLLMIAVALSVGGSIIGLLYQESFEKERSHLIDIVKSQARLMEAVARFDAVHSQEDHPGGAAAATLSQIEDAFLHYEGYGETGSFVMGQKEGDQITFLAVYHRGKKLTVPPVSWGKKIAIPMHRALAGEVGAMVARDYRGEMVLAAYEPVSILNVGIVAKIDLAEVRKPFIATSMVAIGIAFVIIAAGGVLFLRIGNPILEQIKGQNEALKAAKEGLGKAQGIAHLGSWKRTIGNYELWWSDEVYRIFGVDSKQATLSYHTFFDAIHPDDQEKVKAAVSKSLANLQSYETEYRITRPDGMERVIHELGEIQSGMDGKPQYMIGTIHDITTRKKAEEYQAKLTGRLEEALLFNENILNQSPIGIAIFDYSGQCILVNPALTKLVGATQEEMLKLNYHNLESWRKTDLYEAALLAINNNRSERVTVSTVSTFGKSINLACYLAPFVSRDHIQLLLMADDITHKLEAERALAESERTVRLLLNSTAEAIYGIDLEGRCTFANPACIKMLGYDDVNELLGKSMHDLIHYAYPDGSPYPVAECHVYGACLKGEGAHIDSEVLWKKDGVSFPVEYWSYPICQEDKIIGSVVTFLDITLRREFESELKKSKEEADLANQAKSQFLACMSHEIRTPMNAIIGIADILKESELTAENRKLVTVLDGAANGLLDLINDILDLAKIEAGQTTVEYREVIPEVLIHEVISATGIDANSKDIELIEEIAPLVPDEIECDPKCLRQVLLNLVSNAIKFTEKGVVSIKVEPYMQTENHCPGAMSSMPAHSVSSDGFLHFTVKDTGIGVPADRLDAIFDSFTQADESITSNYGGTGLGLAISKNMVALMGGRIWVESELGKGSTFHFTAGYKLAKRDSGAAELIEAEAATTVELVDDQHSNPLNILVAEDSEDIVILMNLYFRDLPHKLDIIENGELVVQQFKKKSYDIVLMDMQMPIKDGYTATREIREWEDKEKRIRTPIIAVTAHALKGSDKKCFDVGCSGYLSKPFKKQDLFKAINRHLIRADHD